MDYVKIKELTEYMLEHGTEAGYESFGKGKPTLEYSFAISLRNKMVEEARNKTRDLNAGAINRYVAHEIFNVEEGYVPNGEGLNDDITGAGSFTHPDGRLEELIHFDLDYMMYLTILWLFLVADNLIDENKDCDSTQILKLANKIKGIEAVSYTHLTLPTTPYV